MTVYAAPGSTFEASVSNGTTGLVGTIGVRISNLATDVDFLARTTAGITEYPAASGIYAKSFTAPTVAGTYALIWDTGGGTPIYAREDLVVAYSAQVGSVGGNVIDLCTVADVKDAFTITNASQDTLLQELITAASRVINQRYNREFTPLTTTTRTFRIDNRICDFGAYDLRAATTVTLDPNGSPSVLTLGTDFKLLPINTSALGTYLQIALSRQRTLSSQAVTNFGYGEISILGDWGAYATAGVPMDIRRAAVETVGSWRDRSVAAYASVASLGDQQFSTLPDRFAGWYIPSTAHRILANYDRVVV